MEGNHSSRPHGSIVMRTVFKAGNLTTLFEQGYGRFSGERNCKSRFRKS